MDAPTVPQHLDPDTAAAYATGALSSDERAVVDGHIDECSDCRELVAMVLRAAPTPSPSVAATLPRQPGKGDTLPRGAKVGPFEVEEMLDAGGMGMVYTAHDARLDRRVALKALRDHHGSSEQLRREARLMAQLTHPNVVSVYDVIDAHGQVFIAMELVKGQSLRQWLHDKSHSWQRIVDVFIDIGEGLAAAHAAGIVHGDIKPGNVLVGDDGRVRVTDFGLAAYWQETLTGQVLAVAGTPGYMPPELKRELRCTPLGDQYSFAATLYEALDGAMPDEPPKQQRRVPGRLRAIVERGLSRVANERYPSMTELVAELRALRRPPYAAIGLSTAAVALVAIAAAFFVGGRRVEAAQCDELAGELGAPWTADAKQRVHAAFTGTKLAFAEAQWQHVDATLDKWSAELDRERRSACQLVQLRHERLPLQLGCLKDQAREARALIGALGEADQTIVTNAVASTERLGSPAACARLAPKAAAPLGGPEVEALRDGLARYRAVMDSGKYRDAATIAQELVAKADALADPTLRASARVALGTAQVRTGDEHGAATLLEAVRLAELGQDDRVRAQAWGALVLAEYTRGHNEQAVFLKEPALGAAERVGEVSLETDVLTSLSASLSQLGRLDEAQELAERAVQKRLAFYGANDRRTAQALMGLGNILAMRGELEPGIEAHGKALAAFEASLGAGHPIVGVLHGNLGNDYLFGLDTARAVEELERAVAIFEAGEGPVNRHISMALTDLGFAQLETNATESALASFERACAQWKTLNAKHPNYGEALFGRYVALERLGRPHELGDLETAAELTKQNPAFQNGQVLLALAHAVQGPRALELATAARDKLKTSQLPLVKRWLADAEALVAQLSSR